MKALLDSLSEEIKKKLENLSAEVISTADDSFQETAKGATETLEEGGSYQEGTRAYTRD